LEVRLHRLKKS